MLLVFATWHGDKTCARLQDPLSEQMESWYCRQCCCGWELAEHIHHSAGCCGSLTADEPAHPKGYLISFSTPRNPTTHSTSQNHRPLRSPEEARRDPKAQTRLEGKRLNKGNVWCAMLPRTCTSTLMASNEAVSPPQVVQWLVYRNHLPILPRPCVYQTPLHTCRGKAPVPPPLHGPSRVWTFLSLR